MIVKSIPSIVGQFETLFRTLYSPYHYDEKKGKPKPSAIQPRANDNEVSTTRKDYASLRFCLNHAHKYERPEKTFSGFLKIPVGLVCEAGANVQAAPVEDNPAHANIVYPKMDFLHGEDVEPLRAEVREIQAKIIKGCKEVIPKEIETDLESIEKDSAEYPDCGYFPFSAEQ